VVEEGRVEAARVSPTNAGLLLNARQCACELGFLTVPEFAELTHRTLDSLVHLEKFHGHLCNWYDTETLQPMGTAFVSSVDSGNLLASLYTLRAGALDLRRKSLLHRCLFSGLRAHWRLLGEQEHLPDSISRLKLPRSSATITAWLDWLPSAESELSAVAATWSRDDDGFWWLNETLRLISAVRTLVRDYLPWMLPDCKQVCDKLGMPVETSGGSLSIDEAISSSRRLANRLAEAHALADDPSHVALAMRLCELLPTAEANLRKLAAELETIEETADRLAEAMDFSCLAHPTRNVLSIGFDTRKQKIEECCYDLFASEARLATFLAIARDELSQQSWLKLKREHSFAYGEFLPSSWTGTMFEYLMPGLWIQSHYGTLTAQAESSCVHVQQAFARRLHIPWGISESGSAEPNDAGDYGYRAFGVPPVALSPEATAGPVISPYSTFLALPVRPLEALLNLHRMQSAGWVGPFGFYEAGDYSTSLRSPAIVREWMAHHQGMSLLAMTNVLHHNIVKRWFHANPIVQANELLLHELPASRAALRKSLKGLTVSPAA
jgi:cyclic beta-1,2-glucan synthetase